MEEKISVAAPSEISETVSIRRYMQRLHAQHGHGKLPREEKTRVKTTSTERGRVRRERLRKAGYIEKPVWLKPQHWPLLKKIIKALNADAPLPLADLSSARAVVTEEDVKRLSADLSERAHGILRTTAKVVAGASDDTLARLERQLKILEDTKPCR